MNKFLRRAVLIPGLFFLIVLILLHRPVMQTGFLSYAGITFFSEGLLVILAGGLLLLRPERCRTLLMRSSMTIRILFLILLASGVFHFLAGGFYRPEFFGINLFWCVIPLFGACYRTAFEKYLPPVLSLVWVADFPVSVFTRIHQGNYYGITGNWNWTALLMVAILPFVLIETGRLGLGVWSRWTAAAATVCVLWFSDSRAAYLALVVCGVTALVLRHPAKRRILLGCSVILVLGVMLAVFRFAPGISERFLAEEIRPALWESAAAMLSDHPHGVGGASYENMFLNYRTIPYFTNANSAIRTVHPHNEFLYLAGVLGIAAALAFAGWLAAAGVTFLKRYDEGGISPVRCAAFYAFAALFTGGMFDLAFHAWPLGILSLIFFGFFAFPAVRRRIPEGGERFPGKIFHVAGWCVVTIAVLGAASNFLGTLYAELSHESYVRNFPMSGRKYAEKAFLFAPDFPNLIYRTATDALAFGNDPAFALALAEKLQTTPWRDFAHIHGLKARACAVSGDDEKAVGEYLLDAKNFPLQILPWFGASAASMRLGRESDAALFRAEARKRILLRGLSAGDVNEILRNPEYDMHPQKIKKVPQ